MLPGKVLSVMLMIYNVRLTFPELEVPRSSPFDSFTAFSFGFVICEGHILAFFASSLYHLLCCLLFCASYDKKPKKNRLSKTENNKINNQSHRT